ERVARLGGAQTRDARERALSCGDILRSVYSGCVSSNCVLSGSFSHSCLREAQNKICGGTKDESSKQPADTMAASGIFWKSEKTVAPQVGQKCPSVQFPDSPVSRYALCSPEIFSAAFLNCPA